MTEVVETWDHRVVRHLDQNGSEYFGVHAVHYEGEYDDSICAWEQEPVSPIGDTMDDLKAMIEDMLLAFDQPILNEEDLPVDEDEDDESDE